jgi:cytidyltransferase-like protein
MRPINTDATVVWEGRFQPIHRGHVAYLQELSKLAPRIIVVVLNNELSTDPGRTSVAPSFSAVVDGHHTAERNPWPLWLRHRLVLETVRAEMPDCDVTVLAGHRLDLDWPFYTGLLPPNRFFATPMRDDFEDAKAETWQALGEHVRRIDVSHLPTISGTLVRERLDNRGRLDDLLCPSTLELLQPYLDSVTKTGGST